MCVNKAFVNYELSELLTYQLISRALITATSIYNVIYINIIQTLSERSFDRNNVFFLDTFYVKQTTGSILFDNKKQIYLYLHYTQKRLRLIMYCVQNHGVLL